MVNEGNVLGHRISGRGIEVDSAKIDAIEKLSYPLDVKGIHSFLGHVGFYRRFIKNFLSVSKPLTNILQKSIPFNFNEDCIPTFEQLKKSLIAAPILKPPKWDQPFEVICETDNDAVSTILAQYKGNELHIIHYASRTLNDAQRNYDVDDRELYAAIFACGKFRPYISDARAKVFMYRQAVKPF